jgi:hypothetical protein
VLPLLDPNLLQDGLNAAGFAALITGPQGQPQGFVITGGGVAPYSGAQFTGTAPGPAITYDANNCVTAIWVYTSGGANTLELTDTIPAANAAGVCTGGTWLFAGDGHLYTSELSPAFSRSQSHTGYTYKTTFGLFTDPTQTLGNLPPSSTLTPYQIVVILGPGITTIGAAAATTPSFVLLFEPPVPTPPAVLPLQNGIVDANGAIDPFYGANASGLQSCAAILAGSNTAYTSATPCFNSSAVAGSDYTIGFYSLNSSFQPVLLSAQMQRLNISISGVAVPVSYYPTITAVTPASASIAAGTATTVTTTWTLPPGAASDSQGLDLYNGSTHLFGYENNVAPTATSNGIPVPGLQLVPTTGTAHVNTVIGGLTVSTGTSF